MLFTSIFAILKYRNPFVLTCCGISIFRQVSLVYSITSRVRRVVQMKSRGLHASTLFMLRAALVFGVLYSSHPVCSGDTLSANPPSPSDLDDLRLIFFNDTTQIYNTKSPFNPTVGSELTDEMINASVDEIAESGTDVLVINAGPWLPFWKSKSMPIEEQWQWMQAHFGIQRAVPLIQYLMKGGDVVQTVITRCRAKGLSVWANIRLNDYHGIEFLDCNSTDFGPEFEANDRALDALSMVTRFQVEHPQYRLFPEPPQTETSQDPSQLWTDPTVKGHARSRRLMNWAIPEVRQERMRRITELLQSYDLDGIVLDFMRHGQFFRLDKTSAQERENIMAEFVTRVRKQLNDTGSQQQPRHLAVRIPSFVEVHGPLGINVQRFAQAGVDLAHLSAHFSTVQQSHLKRLQQQAPTLPLYQEVTFCTAFGPSRGGAYDASTKRYATQEQLWTLANLAYKRGAHGIATFNFVYYREHAKLQDNPVPFKALEIMTAPHRVAQLPQHYFIGNVWSAGRKSAAFLPQSLTVDTPLVLDMDMAPPDRGWTTNGILRIQGKEAISGADLSAKFNGIPLEPESNTKEPYASPYTSLLGTADRLCAWRVPRTHLRDGINKVEFRLLTKKKVVIEFVDLAIP
jgi:hypothetical protein